MSAVEAPAYKCTECDRAFPTGGAYTAHMSRTHGASGDSWPRLTDDQRRLVEANIALVPWVLKRMRIAPTEYDDKFQDGLLGLIRAAQKYEPARGFTFSTYAHNWIRAGIQSGTARFEGSGYRRALLNDEPYLRPVSLDTPPRGDDDSGTLLDLIAAVDADPTEQIEHDEAGDELLRLVLTVARDHIDHTLAVSIAEGASLKKAAAAAHCSGQVARNRLDRISARLRHPTARNLQPDKELDMSVIDTPSTNGSAPTMPARPLPEPVQHPCPDCGRTFGTVHALGVHRGRTHKAAGATPAPVAQPTSVAPRPRPKLDTATVKASMDDYDPWLIVVGHLDEGEPSADTVVLSTEHDARQVAALLSRLGNKPLVFRARDGQAATAS